MAWARLRFSFQRAMRGRPCSEGYLDMARSNVTSAAKFNIVVTFVTDKPKVLPVAGAMRAPRIAYGLSNTEESG